MNQSTPITFFFKTYGCQANVADSEQLAKLLTSLGASSVTTEQEADLIIVNTCAVREKAELKLYSYLGALAELRKNRPYLKLGVIGCVASYRKQELYQRFDHINFVYGAREEMEALQAYLIDLVVNLETTKQLYAQQPTRSLAHAGQDRDVKKIMTLRGALRTPLSLKPRSLPQVAAAIKTEQPAEVGRSFINIMTGCNKYCTYCIVPFTRGREVSYPMSTLIDRVKHDVATGAREINLIGQNVNSYIDPETNHTFSELLRRIAAIPGEFWVRYVSPHPQDMTTELFDVMAAHRPKLTGYVHFPMQSGSNRILQAMNRNYSIETYLEKIGWVRERMPDATLTTDIIVGFPGETEEDYQATRAAIEQVRFDHIYSFVYSPRKYTKAFKLPDDCPQDVKQERLHALQRRQIDICYEQNLRNIGKKLRCLVEKQTEDGRLLARTEGNVRVLFNGSQDLISQFVFLEITSTGPANMEARVAHDQTSTQALVE